LEDIVLPRDGYAGYLLRGLIYSLVASVDPEYFKEVHSGGVVAPFSLFPPIGASGGRVSILRRVIKKGALFRFEVRSFSPRFTRVIADAISSKDKVKLGGVGIEILSRRGKVIDSEHLLRVGKSMCDSRKMLVSFRTPTSIRYRVPQEPRRIVSYPLPDPRPILSSLYSIWNTYLKPKMDRRFLDWVLRMGVCVAGFRRMRTVRLFDYEGGIKKRFDVGFLGLVRYSLLDELYDKRMARYAYALFKMAEYSNIGKGRTAGLGVVKLLRPKVEM